jgi:glucose dehydrogenase
MATANAQRSSGLADRSPSRLARTALVAFLLTFMAVRGLVFLIMARAVPDLYVHVGGNHVHHLNLGIVLLAAAGAWLLLLRPSGKALSAAAAVYGVGLALTFDEFGMWFHLGGSYWQRASFDAVVVVAGLLALIAFLPTLRRFRPRHWATAILLVLAVAVFAVGLTMSFKYAGRRIGPTVHRVERTNPP